LEKPTENAIFCTSGSCPFSEVIAEDLAREKKKHYGEVRRIRQIYPQIRYLVLFFRNLLLGETNDLKKSESAY
jgi:hypothetical protein